MILRAVPRFAREEDRPEGPRRSALEALGRYHSAAKAYRRVEVADWLVRDYRFSPDQAEAIARRLLRAAPEIRGAFLRWWATGRLETVRVEGYSLRELVRGRGMHPIGAMLALSLLNLDPEDASEELDRIEGDAEPGGTDPHQIRRFLEVAAARPAAG